MYYQNSVIFDTYRITLVEQVKTEFARPLQKTVAAKDFIH